MSARRDHDVVGVGLGPFNLGLAALLDGAGQLDAVFFDAAPRFGWHEGLMVEGADLQVPFLADLVTLADPTSPHSFLNYLHEEGRLYRFYFHERLHVLRREFAAYCRWVAERLGTCRFGHRVEAVRTLPGGGCSVSVRGPGGEPEEHGARAVVLGVGSVPAIPPFAGPALGQRVVHSGDYLDARTDLLAARSITVVGSGQSAAEIVLDLLRAGGERRLDWLTRSDGFLPMEYSKLGLEHFSPEYTEYFHGLACERREVTRAGQDRLYKGISADTSAAIFDELYALSVERSEPDVHYRARSEVRDLRRGPDGQVTLDVHQLDQDVAFQVRTGAVVLATGYTAAPLPVPELAGIAQLDELGRPVIGLDYRIQGRTGTPLPLFVQNAELHSHGVGAPDLGLGAHRNAVIVNTLLGREVYPVRRRNVFQRFGAPGDAEEAVAVATTTAPTGARRRREAA